MNLGHIGGILENTLIQPQSKHNIFFSHRSKRVREMSGYPPLDIFEEIFYLKKCYDSIKSYNVFETPGEMVKTIIISTPFDPRAFYNVLFPNFDQ